MGKRSMMLKMTSLFGCGALIFSLAGCSSKDSSGTSSGSNSNSNSGPNAGSISVVAYNGGYGSEWLDTIADEFTKETGILVNVTTDSNILSKIESQLTAKQSDYDVYMSHGLDWQNYASRDLLASLDDLYATDVKVDDTTTTKFVDRLLTGTPENCRYLDDTTNETHYFKVPFTQGAGGFVYNIDMFKAKGWTIPTTYDQLKTLCGTIVAAGITPFAWSSARDYYWDYPIYEWWCEMAGTEAGNDGLASWNEWMSLKDSNGNYANGFENWNPDGKGADFKKAYDMWYNLIAMNPTYANDKAYNASLITAQNLFFNGKAAMIPYGQWAKKEIELAMTKDFTFNVGMMPTPKVSASTAKNYNFMVGYGDSMIVPKNSPAAANAQKFLAFMSTAYACKTFVKEAQGPFLAFDYSKIDLSDIEADDTYIKSLHEILNNAVNFSTVNNNPIVITNGDTFIQPWVANNRYYKQAAATPTGFDATTTMATVYKTAKTNWTAWVRNAGVK
jgi:N-acetylglucosamine transport system substrate-binding protein